MQLSVTENTAEIPDGSYIVRLTQVVSKPSKYPNPVTKKFDQIMLQVWFDFPYNPELGEARVSLLCQAKLNIGGKLYTVLKALGMADLQPETKVVLDEFIGTMAMGQVEASPNKDDPTRVYSNLIDIVPIPQQVLASMQQSTLGITSTVPETPAPATSPAVYTRPTPTQFRPPAQFHAPVTASPTPAPARESPLGADAGPTAGAPAPASPFKFGRKLETPKK